MEGGRTKYFTGKSTFGAIEDDHIPFMRKGIYVPFFISKIATKFDLLIFVFVDLNQEGTTYGFDCPIFAYLLYFTDFIIIIIISLIDAKKARRVSAPDSP